MRIKRLECKSCGANLTKKFLSRRYVCNYCGSTYVFGRDIEYDTKEQNNNEVQGKRPESKESGYKKTENKKSENKKSESNNAYNKKSGYEKAKIVAVIGTVSVILYLTILYVVSDTRSLDNSWKNSTSSNSSQNSEIQTVKKEKALDYPESEYMKKVLACIFDKPFEEITKEEICSIRYFDKSIERGLGITEDFVIINYSFEDYHDYDSFEEFKEKALSVKISENELPNGKLPDKDYTCLKGLNYSPDIDLDDVVKYEDGFENLTGIGMYNKEEDIELLKEVTKKYDIDMLMVELSIILSDTDLSYEWLLECGDISRLSISMESQSVFPEKVGQITNLKELIVTSAEEVKDFSVISKLKNLKALKLEDARSVKTLDFIKPLELNVLDIECIELKDYSVLRDNDSITKLRIDTAYENASFEPMSTMKKVKELDVEIRDFTDYELIGRLHDVEKLTVTMFDSTRSLEFLSQMTKLKEAKFQGCTFNGNLSVLSNAKELKKVAFINGDSNYITKDLDVLKNLEELILDVPYGNIIYFEELLQNDRIKKLTIYNGELWFGEPLISNKSKLEELVLINVMPIDKDYQKTEFDEYFKEICNISTLKKLEVVNCNLSDISGISKLVQLEKLDISNNYVSDVSELSELKNLKSINLFDNAISDDNEIELDCYTR